MTPLRLTRPITIRHPIFAAATGLFLLLLLAAVLWFWLGGQGERSPYRYVSTLAGTNGEFGETFGIAVKGSDVYVSDGETGKIWRVGRDSVTVFAEGLDTPSAIAFNADGDLIAADPGSHTIRSIGPNGEVSIIAGVENRPGFADGDTASTQFNAPVGVAVAADGTIYVADTYNDRIRVIEDGKVRTLAGSKRGFADGSGDEANFDTPAGVAVWRDKLLVADTGNRRIRVVEPDGRVWTLTGGGNQKDGLLSAASFIQPTAIAVDRSGVIFVSDGNAIRQIGGVFPVVRTISAGDRGIKDGFAAKARFNRPSGMAIDNSGSLLVADSENRLIRRFSATSDGREITSSEVDALREKPGEFRSRQPARWPYDPPAAKRDIAGTLAEIRGEIKEGSDQVWFHNGLDIAGAYGETATFIRDEKVLRPVAAEFFGTLRELIRLPTLGYIHIRLGRGRDSIPFGDPRFLFDRGDAGKLTGVRVLRGSKFKAGDAIGTLNSMNHVHLIAGRSGAEMNAIDALTLPGLTDLRPPTIEQITITDENWRELETDSPKSRISLRARSRIIVKAYDQVDGNSERRRLGVYRLGYQILNSDGMPQTDVRWTITFDRLPPPEAVRLVYADGSRSGATGETIFRYIVTNFVSGDEYREDFLDTSALNSGNYTLRVNAADYFGNIASKDIAIEVIK